MMQITDKCGTYPIDAKKLEQAMGKMLMEKYTIVIEEISEKHRTELQDEKRESTKEQEENHKVKE